MHRRRFLTQLAGITAATSFGALGAEQKKADGEADAQILERIHAHRPSRLAKLPADFRERVGASHVAGKYHLTDKPFLLEGAEKLLELGSRLGKFWFIPDGISGSYRFNSRWEKYATLTDLAKSDYFQQLLALPFATLMLEAHAPVENGWHKDGQPDSFYQAITQQFYDVTAHYYRACRDRDITIILQHWEGDWMLRGKGGELWTPPPADWRQQCEQMQRWLKARQDGVTKARKEYGANARCRVAHATEVNRVADMWAGIPTMTEHVLPGVDLDLVSYSSYDGMVNPLTLWKCIAEIKAHARTGSLFGPRAVYVGEMGIPENDQPNRIAERWDEFMGVMLAADVKYVAHWEVYCNEFSSKAPKPVKTPITDPAHVRGFWLVKPDGSLSESGKYFQGLWQRAKNEGKPGATTNPTN